MENRNYYLKNGEKLDRALEAVSNAFPCFIEREFIEMDHSKISIKSRVEDADAIDKALQKAYQGDNFN